MVTLLEISSVCLMDIFVIDMYVFFLFQTISSRLKRSLPDNLSEALSDGVLLCHLANQIRPRSVASVHVPSPAVVCISKAVDTLLHSERPKLNRVLAAPSAIGLRGSIW